MARRIGIIGLGTVGAEVARQLQASALAGCELVAVCARDEAKERGLKPVTFFTDAITLVEQDDIDVVIELVGGSDGIAYEVVKQALQKGKAVITANKALMAVHGVELSALAEAQKAPLFYEAAVAGGIPIIKTLREALAGNQITRISGILNGTCNYILSEMAQTGQDFVPILARAQDLGYAEADPEFDVEGIDAAQKLSLLAALAFDIIPQPDHIETSGIRAVSAHDIQAADELGYVIRLLAIAEKTENGIRQIVAPMLVRQTHQLSYIEGVENAVLIEGEPVGRLLLQGAGAGAGATASAVLGDIADIINGNYRAVFMQSAETLTQNESASPAACKYYLRLNLIDKPGSMASLTSTLAAHNVSIEEIIQRAQNSDSFIAVILVAHEIDRAKIDKAVQALEREENIQAVATILSIL